jgi:chromate reductase
VISVSPGTYGAFGANHHLRQSLVSLDMPCMQQPEAYIAKVRSAWDEAGQLVAPTEELLKKFVTAFAQWCEQLAPKRAHHSAA